MGRRRWPVRVTASLALLLGVVVTVGVLLAAGSAGAPGGPVTSSGTGALPPAGQAGPARVELSVDAHAHPRAEAVRALLQSYFDAVNGRDYRAWTATVVSDLPSQQPPAKWARDLRTTRDGTIRVRRIEPAGPSALLVLLSFVSVQAPEDAPADLRVGRICWDASFGLAPERGGLRIDARRAGSVLRHPC